MDEYYDDDYSLTGDEALDYIIYEDMTEGHNGNGCLALMLLLITIFGVTIT